MLERQTRNRHPGAEVRRPAYLGAVQAVEDFAGVGGEGCEDLGARGGGRVGVAGEGHEAAAAFGVVLGFGVED